MQFNTISFKNIMCIIGLLYFLSDGASMSIALLNPEENIINQNQRVKPSLNIFPELVLYSNNCDYVSEKYRQFHWGGKNAYIEISCMKKGILSFFRVRTYILSFHPAGIECGVVVQYFRESWYNEKNEGFIEDELHPYSKRRYALIDLNLFWDDPEYAQNSYRVSKTILRNMTFEEKEYLLHNILEILDHFQDEDQCLLD